EQRCVLQQLRQKVNDIVDGSSHDGQVRRDDNVDAGVLLDFGGGGSQHVGDRDRAAPATPPPRPRQDYQVLGVASHTRGQVVDAEQLLQLLRVGGAALHGVEQCELAMQ